MDLGANEWATFRKVTLPLIAPAILAATLLCFAISIDDFVVTYFNAGSSTTFPLFVWGAARVGAPPQVNVIGTAIFGVAVIGMAANVLIQAIRQTGPDLNTEKLIDNLETMRNIDLGLGTALTFGRAEHQASHKIWGTAIDESGKYTPLELD